MESVGGASEHGGPFAVRGARFVWEVPSRRCGCATTHHNNNNSNANANNNHVNASTPPPTHPVAAANIGVRNVRLDSRVSPPRDAL